MIEMSCVNLFSNQDSFRPVVQAVRSSPNIPIDILCLIAIGSIFLSIGSMYIRNNQGEETVPWGDPQVSLADLLRVLSKRTRNRLSARKS